MLSGLASVGLPSGSGCLNVSHPLVLAKRTENIHSFKFVSKLKSKINEIKLDLQINLFSFSRQRFLVVDEHLKLSFFIDCDGHFFECLHAAGWTEKFGHDAGGFETRVTTQNKCSELFDNFSVQCYHMQAHLF